MNVHTYELLYLGNGTSDHRNEKTKTLCNTKYPPKPKKTHLRNHFFGHCYVPNARFLKTLLWPDFEFFWWYNFF